MSLEEYIPSEWVSESQAWVESSREQSEKYREQQKKAQAWIKRTQKDEKKAKTYDMLLAWFLVKIIVNDKYSTILDDLFKLLDKWYPSNFLLWVISLIYIDISNKIRDFSKKQKIKFHYKNNLEKEFKENDLDKEVQDRINLWIEDIIDSVTIEYSVIMTKRLKELLLKDDYIIVFVEKVFYIFLKELNFKTDLNKLKWISIFILKQVYSKIRNLKIEEI